LEFKNFTVEQLLELERYRTEGRRSFQSFFSNNANLQMLEQLESLGLRLANEKKEMASEGKSRRLTFLFTGTLQL
jgi:NAD-dependent DNA ligase